MAFFTAKELYSLKLGDCFMQGWECLRVPGGWIFSQGNGSSSVFVPWHNEFQPDEGESND